MTTAERPDILPMSANPFADFRYFYKEGMPLRPAPQRRTETPSWSTLRHNLFDNWHDVKDDWDGYNSDQNRLLDDHMWQCDETGLAVAEMFKRVGAKKGRADFETALSQGIEKVDNPEPELVEFFRQVDNVPEWIDMEAAGRGRIAYYNVTFTSETLAIAFAYWATTMEDRTSAATGETGMFDHKAMQRSVETAKFFVDLGREDVFDRYSDGLKAAVRVRLLHAQANRGLEKLWGPEHFNEFGRPIGSSFLVSGEGWFALMPLAIDELFGRPHSGQEWDDVAMYWAYVLYMMGAEERIIPKTGDEMRKMTDYIYANGGQSSDFHQEVATALMSILENLNPALPIIVLGALCTVVGEDDVRFMVKGTKWEKLRFKPVAWMYGTVARMEARAARLRDKLPGAEQAKVRRAGRGKPPWSTVLGQIEAHIAKNNLGVEAKFNLHDNSKEALN
ncbi:MULTISPECIES: oxygenase MpaB family protein [Corynebacterium]|mgnify:CR=1 FL=1|uniref:oxygenase MpaB family protein n=1 Tax=Corynebacterium TaxID=1716 RepID=UPI001D16BDF4|nr:MULTISPECIES: oxygenase MpaB family protein [Corynebacterium]